MKKYPLIRLLESFLIRRLMKKLLLEIMFAFVGMYEKVATSISKSALSMESL
jgi:hypothetical protein